MIMLKWNIMLVLNFIIFVQNEVFNIKYLIFFSLLKKPLNHIKEKTLDKKKKKKKNHRRLKENKRKWH